VIRAYQMIGYTPDKDYRYIETNRALRAMHPAAVDTVISEIRNAGGEVTRHLETDLLHINQEFSASVVIVRCHSTPNGARRWKVRLDYGLRPDITVAVRMTSDNQTVHDYYLLPWLDVGTLPSLRLAPENGVLLDAYRFDTLDPFFDLTRRTAVRAAA